MLKILHIIPDLKQTSGPTTFCVNICDHIADEQADVMILHGTRIDTTSLIPKNHLVRLIDDWRAVRQGEQPDIIHIHALWSPFSHAGARYARKHKTPYVISAHGMLAPWALKHKWLKKKLAWLIYQRRDLEGAAMFHVTAECEIKWLRDLGFKQPCVLAPLGSDLPKLYSSKKPRSDIKTVLFVGRIHPVKGLTNLVRAWAEVKPASLRASTCATPSTFADTATVDRTVDKTPSHGRSKVGLETGNWELETRESESQTHALMDSRTNELPHWQLVIAGPDQTGHKAEVVAEARRLGLRVEDSTINVLMHSRTNELPPDLIFLGPLYGADKDALHRIADLFVLPSFTENFGVVVTDALSYGIPVITTQGTPWRELENCANSFMPECANDDDRGAGNKARWSSEETIRRMSKEQAIITQSGSSEHSGNHSANAESVSGNKAIPLTRAGWWIDIGVEPLADALKEAMAMSDDERHALGVNGRQLVETKYTWPASAFEMKRAYELLLKSFELLNVKASKVLNRSS